MKEIRSVQLARTKIGDKETVQLQNFSTDIEKIYRKEIDNVELDKPDTEERDRIKISD